MTSREFRDRLTRRARRARLAIPPDAPEILEAYFRLLDRWNSKINLTALPLQSPTDETFDRLFIEPLAVSRYVQNEPSVWLDLGSGGGSPAIPLKIVRPNLELTMVESKARKAAFLREAIRSLRLADASVENARFESLAESAAWKESAAMITARAVKADPGLFATAAQLLTPGGRLMLFRPSNAPIGAKGFEPVETVQLTDAPRTFVAFFKRVFHVEQSR